MANNNPTAPIKPDPETGNKIVKLTAHTGWSKAELLAEALDHYYEIGMALPEAPKSKRDRTS